MNFPTAMELQIRVHYKEWDDQNGPWDSIRVKKLCRLLQITIPELARMIRVMPGSFQGYLNSDKFPDAVKLLLDIVERGAHKDFLGSTPTKTLFPRLNG